MKRSVIDDPYSHSHPHFLSRYLFAAPLSNIRECNELNGLDKQKNLAVNIKTSIHTEQISCYFSRIYKNCSIGGGICELNFLVVFFFISSR